MKQELDENGEIFCEKCMGDYLLGERLPNGDIHYPEVGKAAIESFTESGEAILICRECDHIEPIDKNNLVIVG